MPLRSGSRRGRLLRAPSPEPFGAFAGLPGSAFPGGFVVAGASSRPSWRVVWRSGRRSCRSRSRRRSPRRCAAGRRGSCTRAQRLSRKGRFVPRSPRSAARSARQGNRCARGSRRSHGVKLVRERPSSASLSARDLGAQPAAARARRGPPDRSCPFTSASSIARPDVPRMSVATQSSLIPVSS